MTAAAMGVGIFPTESTRATVGLVALAESLGYRQAWIGDSQNIWREAFVTIAAASVATERIVLATGVTNGSTRHPSVIASACASLDELTDGRFALGMGAGDSSLRTMGLKPMALAELERTVSDIRRLLAGDAAVEATSGSRYHLQFPAAAVDVPIYLAASAPKITRLAGRVADGVVLAVGADPAFVARGLERVGEGARAAGRSGGDVRTVLWLPAAIRDDGKEARDLVRAHVARSVNRPFEGDLPPEEIEAVERIRASYDYYGHMDPRAQHAELVTDALVRRFALAGTPSECRLQLEELAGLVDQVAIIPVGTGGDERAETMRRFAAIFGPLSEEGVYAG